MKASLGLLSIAVLLISAISRHHRPQEVKRANFAEIDTYLQSLIDTGGVPGIAIAIVDKREILHSHAFGVSNTHTREKLEPQHIFHVASISKTITATAIAQLAEQGKIRLDTFLITYIPYFKMNDRRYKFITIRQILNHTSGMPDVEDYEWQKGVYDKGAAERYTRSLIDKKLISDPGTQFHYSNMAFDIMADLVAKVTGMTFEEYVRQSLLSPLEMDESSFYAPEIKKSLRTSPHVGSPAEVSSVYPYNRMHAPSSTLNTNILELSHWAIANLNDGQYNGKKIMSSKTHSMMFTPTATANAERKTTIGMSWFMYPYKNLNICEHGGSDLGYKSVLTLIPEKDLGIIILSNYEEIRLFDVKSKVIDLLLAEKN